MMRVTFRDGEPVQAIAEVVDRYTVYLDTDSLQELAKGSAERRERFRTALRRRGTLLFSETNAAEAGRLAGRSAERVATLLSSLGPCWVPLRMSVFAALELEDRGAPAEQVRISEWFMRAYVERRQLELAGGTTVLDQTSAEAFAAGFFDLGAVVEWSRDEEGNRGESAGAIDEAVRQAVARGYQHYRDDPGSLDRFWPLAPYSPEHRLRFVVTHVMRGLIREARSRRITKNDGLDLSHAIMATTYASLAALDKAWKYRVSVLPQSVPTARVFYRPELDDLVSELEQLVDGTPHRSA